MTQISKEYGEALFTLAKETGTEKDIFDSLMSVSELLAQNPEYIDFLASPSISKKERVSAVGEAFGGGGVHEYVVSFLQLLCERGHIKSFNKCVEEYDELYRMSQRISCARVISAVPLTKEEKEKIKSKLESLSGHFVTLECSEDPSLIGGAVIHMDGKILDGSLKHRLREMKEVMDK